MKVLTYSLLSDGSSDRALIPIINWLLRQHLPTSILSEQWVDPARLGISARELVRRIKAAVRDYPCDLLFIHRDSENSTWEQRAQEILSAVEASRVKIAVPIVPVRMTEAWLISCEPELRIAAGNAAGTMPLKIPDSKKLEGILDPKETLFDLLKTASGLSPNRLKKFRPHQLIHRLADLIEDFSYLRQISAFQRFEQDVELALIKLKKQELAAETSAD